MNLQTNSLATDILTPPCTWSTVNDLHCCRDLNRFTRAAAYVWGHYVMSRNNLEKASKTANMSINSNTNNVIIIAIFS